MFFFLNSFVKKNQDYVGTGREGKGGGRRRKEKTHRAYDLDMHTLLRRQQQQHGKVGLELLNESRTRMLSSTYPMSSL